MQIEKYQSGNKGFEVVGGKCDDCLGYGGYNLHDGVEGRQVCPTCNGAGATKEEGDEDFPDTFGVLDCDDCNGTGFKIVGGEFEKVIADNRWNINITVRGASESELHLFDLHEGALDDLRSAHNTDMQALRDQLKQSSELIEMQSAKLKAMQTQTNDLVRRLQQAQTMLAQRDGLVRDGRAI